MATLEDLDNADAGLDELHAMKLKELSWSPATEPHRSALLHKPAGGGEGTEHHVGGVEWQVEGSADSGTSSRRLSSRVSFGGKISESGCPIFHQGKKARGEEVALKKIVDLLYARVGWWVGGLHDPPARSLAWALAHDMH